MNHNMNALDAELFYYDAGRKLRALDDDTLANCDGCGAHVGDANDKQFADTIMAKLLCDAIEFGCRHALMQGYLDGGEDECCEVHA